MSGAKANTKVFEIVMPRLGWTMEEGTFLEWLKRDGDPVQIGELLFTVESDKAVNEVEALEAGVLRIPPDSPPPGAVLPVGALLAYIVPPGEPAPFEGQVAVTASSAAGPVAESGAESVAAMPASQSVSQSAPSNGGTRHDTAEHSAVQPGEPAISPRARRIAAELGVEWRHLRGSGSTGRIVERDVRAAAQLQAETRPQAEAQAQQPAAQAAPRATPLARRVAEDLAVNLNAVQAAGKRITRADVEAAAAGTGTSAPTEANGLVLADGEAFQPLTAVRRITAERMAASAHTTAPVTLTAEVDATELVRLRQKLKADAEKSRRLVPSYTDLLAKLCAEALNEHPAINARFALEGGAGDGTGTPVGIITSQAVHIGLAVDTDRGLLVPVLRDVGSRTVRAIAAESAALIERARAGSLKAEEMRGATFTITNLGMFGIDAFTPIINLPACAILGVGRIVPKQVVIDAEAETLAIRHMMFLSLTFDHRLADGATAARFLARVREYIEQPYLFLA